MSATAHPLAGNRELVLASAGSGKTFRISSRIIGLLAAGQHPASIFASTFTRKAAGEILERVLQRLASAAADADGATELAEHVELPAGVTPDPAYWTGLLAATVRSLHELEVGTLDSFFARALRSFGHEAGLPPGWRIADGPERDRLSARVLERVIADGDPGVMVELVRGMRGGDVARSVHEALLRDVAEILVVHRDLADGSPGWSALSVGLGLDGGEAQEEADARRAHALADHMATLELPVTNAGTPRANWVKARDRIRAALAEEDWEGALDQTLVRRALGGGDFDRAEIDQEWVKACQELAGAARTALGRRLQRRADAMARLAERFSRILDDALLDEGALAFDDVIRFLAGPVAPVGRSDLAYRLDGRLRHLLLDEFQDTSLNQWRALRPLADALAGPGAPGDGSASVVADPKQSIYGWRGAAPVIVQSLGRRYELARERLAVSWRSSPVVLDAVNRTFADIAESPVFRPSSSGGASADLNAEIDRATAREWAEAFEPHRAAPRPAQGPRPGHVRLVAGPAKVGRAHFQPALLAHAADVVAGLHRQAPGRSIGVLVRTTRALAQIIYELRRRGVAASEEGGTRLADSPAVVSLLALLRLADHPGDGLAAYHVARTPVGAAAAEALGISGGLVDETDAEAVARLSGGMRRRLVHDGYGPTLSRLRASLRERLDARDARRMDQLVELGYRHDARPTLRSDDFVAAVEAARVESAGDAPVRVMTLWGAKGLEFDAVVLPDLHDEFVRGPVGSGPPLAHRPRPTAPITHAFPSMKSALRALFSAQVPEVASAFADQRAGQVRDALSGLYVAMTRARHALHLVIPGDDGKVSTARTAALHLRQVFTTEPEAPVEPGAVLFEAGDAEWMESLPRLRPALATDPEADGDAIPLDVKSPPRRLRPRRSPSDHSLDSGTPGGLPGPGTWAPGELAPTVKGSIVHGWLEKVVWLDEEPEGSGLEALDRATRRRIARREAPELPPDALDRAVSTLWEELAPQLRERAVRRALGRPGSLRALGLSDEALEDVELEVLNELRFVTREGEGLLQGVVDRIVLARRHAEVVAARVLDYKTDAVLADDGSVDEALLARRVEVYAGQLADYRTAVGELFGVPPEAVRSGLIFLQAGRVVEV